MEWTGQSLAEHRFAIASGGADMIARVGFPRPSDKGSNEWACDFQLVGWKDGRIRVAYGVDGLQALVIAVGEMRRCLDEIRSSMRSGQVYEYCFPRFVTTAYGLEFHHHLCEVLDGEIDKKKREIDGELSRRPSGK
jgi:hypothetical protein